MRLLKNILGLALALALLPCCGPAPSNAPIALAGKTIEYRYGESVYHVNFVSDSTMYWEAMAGDEAGTIENETYVAAWIERDMLFITWGEANGTGVSQVLDFKKGKVHNHLLRGRNASFGEGDIRIIDK